MRITCPSCQATYEVPDAMLGAAARKVRCARCAFEWQPEPAAAAPPTPPAAPAPAEPAEPDPPLRLRSEPRSERPPRAEALPPLPPPERMPPRSAHARSPTPILASLAVVAISLVVLVSLGWAAYAWRAEVMHAWPPSERLFVALGLA